MDLIRDIKYIQEQGEDLWAYAEATSNGVISGSWVDGTYKDKTKRSNQRPEKNIVGESGRILKTVDESDNFSFEIESLQDDIATEEWLTYQTKGKYYSIMIAAGQNEDGYQKLVFYPKTKLQSTYESDSPGRKPLIKGVPLSVSQSLTPTSVPSWVTVSTGSFTVAAGRYHSMASQSGDTIG